MTQDTEPSHPLPCIACGTLPKPVFDGTRQPHGATTFYSEGHYGSTVFDPMRGGVSLTVNICDGCLRFQQERVLLVTESTQTTLEYASWTAPAEGSE